MQSSPYLTRSQQRAQKRQVWILLLLVLGVALGSFALGVVVGRSSRTATHDQRTEQAALPVVRPVPPPPSRETAAPVPVSPPAGQGAVVPAESGAVSRENPVLGSGVNLPSSHAPGANQPEPAAVVKATVAPAPTPVVSRPSAAQAYQVLAASFPDRKDADDFARRLERKGYQPATDAFEVQGKTWFRVSVGPYPDYDSAKGVAEKLQREERVSPVIRKRRS